MPEASRDFYKNALGGKTSEVQHLPDHGVSVVFVELGNAKIEVWCCECTIGPDRRSCCSRSAQTARSRRS